LGSNGREVPSFARGELLGSMLHGVVAVLPRVSFGFYEFELMEVVAFRKTLDDFGSPELTMSERSLKFEFMKGFGLMIPIIAGDSRSRVLMTVLSRAIAGRLMIAYY
jgi:hypothetical protein